MTEIEKTEIINAVIDALNDDSTNYDDKVVEPYADDVILIMRKDGDARVGKCVTWEGLCETITASAKNYAEASGQSATTAEEAKNAANNILEQVQSKGSEITNFVATSKTEIETQKNESVNAVKSVYQADLDELKGDIDDKLPKSPNNWRPWTAEEQAAALEKLGGASAGWKTSKIIEITEDITTLNINLDDGSGLNEIAIVVDGVGSGVALKYKIRIDHTKGNEFVNWNDNAITMNEKYTTYLYLKRFGNYWKSESINPRTPDVYCSTPVTKIIPYTNRQPVNATNILSISLTEYDLRIGSKVYVMTK